jgi:hypothetical protein
VSPLMTNCPGVTKLLPVAVMLTCAMAVCPCSTGMKVTEPGAA